MTDKNTEFFLSQPELLYTLHFLGAKHIAGMELEEFKLPQKELHLILEKGKECLFEQGFIKSKTTRKITSPELVAMVETLGFRDLAIVLVRGIRNYGQQLFIFSFYNDQIVEHTLPEEGRHRLKKIKSTDDFLQRLKQLIPLTPVIQENRPQFKISKHAFDTAFQNLKSGDKSSATKIIQTAGLSQEFLDPFFLALESPEFTISLACLLIKNDKVVSASSTSIFSDERSAWGIWPDNMESDPPILLIFPSGITDIYNAVTDWLEARNQGR